MAAVKPRLVLLIMLYLLALAAAVLEAQTGPEIRIARAAGPIVMDGDLSDPGWKGATKVDTFFETNPGDNVPPKVRTVAYLTYDEKFFYAAFEFYDPDISLLRAPYGDRDALPGYTDYGGVILDTHGSARTAIEYLVNPHNIQYDAIQDDASGEDSSPDYFWDSATKIEKDRWVLEMRIPFSTLRYSHANPQVWSILLYRNYPRAFRYQMFSSKLPRGGNCFICRSSRLRRAAISSSPRTGRPKRSGSRGATSARRSSTSRSGSTAAWTRSGLPTRARRSTQRSIPTSRRSNPTSRRSSPTSGLPSSFRRSVPSSSKGSSSSRLPSRPSTHAASPLRDGACARPER